MSTHAELSPSSAHRWVACPGSVAMCRGIPNTSSVHADWGTAAHALAEVCLTDNFEPVAFLGQTLKDTSVAVDDEMVECVAEYVAIVRNLAAGGELMVEQRVSIEHITGEPGAGGTSDTIIFNGDEAIIVDLKGGRGVKVDAENNKQLAIYAHAAVRQFDLMGDVQRVRMVIVQPRLSHVSEWSISIDELEAFVDEIRAAAQVVHSNDAPRKPSADGCRWCLAKATCPELRSMVISTVADDFVDLTQPIAPQLAHRIDADMDNHTLANCLAAVDLIQSWCKAIEERAFDQLAAGHTVPGYKLVSGRRGNRAWSNESEAEQMLKALRLKQDEMYQRKVISPATAEKLLKDSPRKLARLQGLITQGEGKPTIAPQSDKREAIAVAAAVDEFDIL